MGVGDNLMDVNVHAQSLSVLEPSLDSSSIYPVFDIMFAR
jgi:hypothetical protein